MKISVLMSVFNEELSQISLAVDSILNQTFSDFELIIVNDNPKNDEMKKYLEDLKNKDNRIVIHHNEKNIGLAMSMNTAAKLAKGDVLARMDADDISDITRFEKEYELIKSGKYDVVATGFHYIDENGDKLNLNIRYYSDRGLNKLLPQGNTLHHPTIMFTKEIFDKAGAYRDFPCAQDYDLWLRMYDNGAKIHMIHEDLFAYRVRRKSISGSRKMKQLATMMYMRELYKERKKKGKDSFSLENYNSFLSKMKIDNPKLNDVYIEGKVPKSSCSKSKYMLKVFFKYPFLRRVYMDKVKFVLICKMYN